MFHNSIFKGGRPFNESPRTRYEQDGTSFHEVVVDVAAGNMWQLQYLMVEFL